MYTAGSQGPQLRRQWIATCVVIVRVSTQMHRFNSMSSSNAYVAMIAKGKILAIVVSPPPTITYTICVIDRLEVMSEPLQLVSFTEVVWQVYVTSFPLSLSFLRWVPFEQPGSWIHQPRCLSSVSRCFFWHIQLINGYAAFLFYDHLVTLGGYSNFGLWTLMTEPRKGVEIEHVWCRPWRSGRWFFLNRYFAFFSNLAVLAPNFVRLLPAVRFTMFYLAL